MTGDMHRMSDEDTEKFAKALKTVEAVSDLASSMREAAQALRRQANIYAADLTTDAYEQLIHRAKLLDSEARELEDILVGDL